MNAYTVSSKIVEKLASCSELANSHGLKCKTELECTSKRNKPVSPEDISLAYISGYAQIYADGTDPEDGYEIGIYVPCKRGEVDDELFSEECKFFDEEILALSEGLAVAESSEEFLNQYIQKTDEEAEKMMLEFNREMRKRNLVSVAMLAVGIALIIAAALISALV